MKLEVIPSGGAIGARVHGADLLYDQNRLRALLAKHRVLVLPEQELGPCEVLAVARSFGEVVAAPKVEGAASGAGLHGLLVISNAVNGDGRALGALGSSDLSYHRDLSYDERPPDVMVAYGAEIPRNGGTTRFADQWQALHTLDSETRRAIQGLGSKHDASFDSAGNLRPGMKAEADPMLAPGAIHPFVRRNPVCGRDVLYLGRLKNAYVPGLPREQSDRLLRRLFQHATRPDFVWAHTWRRGDLLLWDNGALLHARDRLSPSEPRTLLRTQVHLHDHDRIGGT
jgi:taurine dioxygenase